MKRTLIKNAIIVNGGKSIEGSVVIEDEKIIELLTAEQEPTSPCNEILKLTILKLIIGFLI